MPQLTKFKIAISSALLLLSSSLHAGYVYTDEQSGIKATIHTRLQSLVLLNDSGYKPDDDIEFRVRRARLGLAIDFNPDISVVLQTELANNGHINGVTKLIDAYIKYNADPWLQVMTGVNMAPVQRQNLTSSGSMLAFDRPGITNYNMTWGMKGNVALQTGTVPGTKLATFGDYQVRDRGVTLFGSGQIDSQNHLKYYASRNRGSRFADNTSRSSFRLQWNHGDAEPSYYNCSSYLGKKQTVAVGIAIDKQDRFAADAITFEDVDYRLFTIDAFIEQPWAEGYLTVESAYIKLDLDDTINPLADFSFEPLSSAPTSQTQGHGYYIQTGYMLGHWQPWVMVEDWQTEDSLNNGSWRSKRIGITYYLREKNIYFKFGIENTEVLGVDSKDITTAALGMYLYY